MNKFLHEPMRYADYRPQYPESLFEYLQTLTSKNSKVLECGAGSGQATIGLSSHFNYIISTEPSFELLLKAKPLSHVYYIQSSAEQLPIHSTSINLVCIAQAIHWFRLHDFYSEVKRVLKPGGVITAWCYNQSEIEPAIDKVINKIYVKITSSQNLSRERQYLYEHYQTLLFPFDRIPSPSFSITMSWNLMQLLGYISTWPSILEYQKRFNIDLISEIKDELIFLWGDSSTEKLITWPIYLLVGRMT